jgi:hypothetical protein
MAVGDDAVEAGFALVPDTGEEGKVKWGAREINRTRDYAAQVKELILATWPVLKGGTGATTKAGARTNLGITSGTTNPSGGVDGDVYFKIVV